MKLSQSDVLGIFERAGVKKPFQNKAPWDGYQLLDDEFQTLSYAQLRRVWEEHVSALPEELIIRRNGSQYPRWEPESGDCENLHYWLMSDVQKMNAVTAIKRSERRAGICAFPINYIAQQRAESGLAGAHCGLAYINHKRDLKFFETQFGRGIKLTHKEIESIWFLLGA